MKKSVKIVKQIRVQNGAKGPVDIKRKLTLSNTEPSNSFSFFSLCNACGLRYARLIAKHEKRQAPKEEDRSILATNNNTTTNTNNNNKLKHPNMPKRKS